MDDHTVNENKKLCFSQLLPKVNLNFVQSGDLLILAPWLSIV
jgi:hypothetical protein